MALKIEEILNELGQKVPGFLATAVVGMDGLGIASYTASKLDSETVNVQMTLLFKLATSSIDKLIEENTQDFLLTTDKAYLLMRYLDDKDYYLGIVGDRSKANLGNIRLISRTFIGRLSDAMPR